MKRLAAAFLLFATAASAQQNDTSKTERKRVETKTEIIFDTGTDIDGDIAAPGLETLYSPPKHRFGSLLKVRDSFKDKLMESVYEL